MGKIIINTSWESPYMRKAMKKNYLVYNVYYNDSQGERKSVNIAESSGEKAINYLEEVLADLKGVELTKEQLNAEVIDTGNMSFKKGLLQELN